MVLLYYDSNLNMLHHGKRNTLSQFKCKYTTIDIKFKQWETDKKSMGQTNRQTDRMSLWPTNWQAGGHLWTMGKYTGRRCVYGARKRVKIYYTFFFLLYSQLCSEFEFEFESNFIVFGHIFVDFKLKMSVLV